MKQEKLVKYVWDLEKKDPDWRKSLKNFYRVDNVPPKVAKTLLTGQPNVNPEDRQNNSPRMKEMIELAEKNKGLLEGYVVAEESGRPDARISFDGMTIEANERKAKQLKRLLQPDEFDNKGKNKWRMWWD
jgi:hypothetical protein